MQFTVNLAAGSWHRQQTAGKMFLLLDDGVSAGVEVRLFHNNRELESVRTAKTGFKATVPNEGFTHVELRSAGAAAIEIVITDGTVDFDFFDGANVNATLVSPLPVPVSNDRGSPGNLMHVTGVSLADAPAVAISNGAAVACTDAEAVLIAADANRRALRFCNIGTDAVAIGAAGITWAARCIVLEPGDVWIEDRAANLAWSAICDATKTASVTVQGVTA